MDPVTLLGVVGSAASIYSALRDYWTRGDTISPGDADAIVREAKAEGERLASDASLAAGVSRLHDRIRQVVHDNIEAEIEDVTDKMRGASPAQSKLLAQRMQKTVCSFLETLRDANGGTFDGEPWAENHWNDFQCNNLNSKTA